MSQTNLSDPDLFYCPAVKYDIYKADCTMFVFEARDWGDAPKFYSDEMDKAGPDSRQRCLDCPKHNDHTAKTTRPNE